MNNIKKFLNVVIFVLSFVGVKVMADDLSLKFNGLFDFGFAKTLACKPDKVSPLGKDLILASGAYIAGTISNKNAEGLEYGARLVMKTTAQSINYAAINGSHIFLSHGNFGKVQLGSQHEAATMMRVSADELSPGLGLEVIGSFHLNPEGLNGLDFNQGEFFFGDWKHSEGYLKGIESSRKISYYTPEFHGLQFGISYIPDTTNSGSASPDKGLSLASRDVRTADKKKYTVKLGAKHAIAFGTTFKHVVRDGFDFKIEFDMERGRVLQEEMQPKDWKPQPGHEEWKPVNANKKLLGDHALSDINTYNIGGVVNLGNWSFGGSYSNLGKSLTSKAAYGDRRNTSLYTAGACYKQGPVKVGITYLKSIARGNTLDGLVVGSDYKFAPGMVVYVNLGWVKASGTPIHHEDDSEKRTYKGTAVAAGVRVSI